MACSPTLLNAETLQRRAHFGKDREKDWQYWKKKHVEGDKADRSAAQSTSRDNRKWWRLPEVNQAQPAIPRKALRAYTTESITLLQKRKKVPNNTWSKRLQVLLYPTGILVSRLLSTVVTIDDKAVDCGGCGRWTWRNLCSLRTPHLCPYLHQRRLFTRAPTLTLWRNIDATEADIWKNQTQAQRNTSREISWHEKKPHKNSDQSEVLLRSVCSMVKTVKFRHPGSMQGMPAKDRSVKQ